MQVIFHIAMVLLLQRVSGILDDSNWESKTQPVLQQQFPFFVQLIIGERMYAHYRVAASRCGGSLIHAQWVLTAAHCFKRKGRMVSDAMLKKDFVQALMGSVKKALKFNSIYHECRNVSKVYILPHYEYKEVKTMNAPSISVKVDIALAKLKTPFELSDSINTVHLESPRDRSPLCKEGIVIGTGIVAPSGQMQDALYFTKVHVKPFDQLSVKPIYKTSSSFYTETEFLRGHPVEGDSGGPYICTSTEFNMVQHGIISIHYNSTNKEHASTVITAYEKVSSFSNFIAGLVDLPDLEENTDPVNELMTTNNPFIETDHESDTVEEDKNQKQDRRINKEVVRTEASANVKVSSNVKVSATAKVSETYKVAENEKEGETNEESENDKGDENNKEDEISKEGETYEYDNRDEDRKQGAEVFPYDQESDDENLQMDQTTVKINQDKPKPTRKPSPEALKAGSDKLKASLVFLTIVTVRLHVM